MSGLKSTVQSAVNNSPATGAGKVKAGSNTATPTTPTPTNPTTTPPKATSNVAGVVPYAPTTSKQVNVADFAAQLVGNPAAFFTKDMKLSNQVKPVDANTPGTTIDGSKYTMDADALKQTAQTTQATTVNQTATAGQVTPQQAQGYEAQQTQQAVSDAAMDAAQGTVSHGAIIDDAEIPTIDEEATAAGHNAVGKALNDYAKQGLTIIDTSTIAGKMLAETLGEGNYTDSKATLKGQLDILSKEFVDEQGNPRIPTWAAGMARAVGRTIAFGGMTGTAATAALSQALMEAALPVASADATFFQTLTIKNLDNKQQQIINKANVLSKIQLANMDARMTAAVNNANAFLQMDLANLSNEQQSRVINTQARVQSILEDANQENLARRFTAESKNEMTKFYDTLATQIDQFNATQKNDMSRFNAQSTNEVNMFNTGQINSMRQFNAELENQREQYYKTMQYNIDLTNAKWRQEVTTGNATRAFEAAALDVRNMVGLGTEQLSRIWDRADSLLDYAWKSSESEADRANAIAIAQLQADYSLKEVKYGAKVEQNKALGGAFTSFFGSEAGGQVVDGLFSAFGW